MTLSRLVTLSISSLRNLDIEANKFYDRAHRLYDALRPYIDSEINHIRHFIKIQFVNKWIEFINLPSISKDKSVIPSIPTYFENKESEQNRSSIYPCIAIILMGKRELVALLNLSPWCLVMVERLFLAVPWGCLRFVIVVFPDHTHLLFWTILDLTEVKNYL